MPICVTTLYFRAASVRARASLTVRVRGFCTYTCFPSCIAAIAITACVWSGVATSTASMSFCFSSITRQSLWRAALGCLSSVPRFTMAALAASLSSQSHSAAMLSLFSTFSRFDVPMPCENPTIATFTVSLGAWNPAPPSTWRGTIVIPAAVAAVPMNVRRDTGVGGLLLVAHRMLSCASPPLRGG